MIRGTREQIAELVRDDILSGRLFPGQRLGEVELAKRFGVSRGPIREAFALLTHEGLLVAKPNCGVSVAPTAPDSVQELIVPVRRTVETYALRLVHAQLTPLDFRKWEDALYLMERACQDKDKAEMVRQDVEFHRLLIERAAQPDITAIWRTLVAGVRGHFHAAAEQRIAEGCHMELYEDHRRLFESFRQRDVRTASESLAAHIW